MRFSRAWAMPSPDTFAIPPIAAFVARYLTDDAIDPFARNSTLARHRNDLNPDTCATYHLDAAEFLALLAAQGIRTRCGLFDPPYSPRQISECYQIAGRKVTMVDTQSAGLKKNVRNAFRPLIAPGGVVLSFGWNTVGMGLKRGFEIIEILLVCHGGDHNDTICMAERRLPDLLDAPGPAP